MLIDHIPACTGAVSQHALGGSVSQHALGVGVSDPGGVSTQGCVADTPPHPPWADRHLWKQPSQTLFAGGNNRLALPLWELAPPPPIPKGKSCWMPTAHLETVHALVSSGHHEMSVAGGCPGLMSRGYPTWPFLGGRGYLNMWPTMMRDIWCYLTLLWKHCLPTTLFAGGNYVSVPFKFYMNKLSVLSEMKRGDQNV